MNLDNAIIVWKFYDAPKEYQELSEHGGDETYVILVPISMKDDYIGWLFSSSIDSCQEPQVIETDEYLIYIGSH